MYLRVSHCVRECDLQWGKTTYLFSRHLFMKSSYTFLNTTTENREYSSSAAMKVDERGTTIVVSRSYLVFQSLTEFLCKG